MRYPVSNRQRFFVLWSLVLLVVASGIWPEQSKVAADGEPDATAEVGKPEVNCAVGAAYIALKSQGIDADVHEVEERFPLQYRSPDVGVPMSTLCDVLAEFGMPARAVRYDPQDAETSWAPGILLLNTGRRRASERQGHFVFLKTVLKDRIVILDSAIPVGDIEIPRNLLDQYWEGYAIELKTEPSTWRDVLLWSLTIGLGLIALHQTTKLLGVFIGKNEHKQPSAAKPITLLSLYVLSSVTACGCGAAGEQESEQLKFERETITVIAPSGESHAKYSLPFSVQGTKPIVITSIDKSCKCAAVGEGIIGKELLPGANYSLPIEVDLTGRNSFKINLVLHTEAGDITGVVLQGVVSSPPLVSPSVIVCEHPSHSASPASGTFTVNYVRRVTDTKLAPVDKIVHGQDIVLTLLESKELTPRDEGNSSASAVLDVLEWRWEFTSDTPSYTREKIAIEWAPEVEIPPSTVTLEKVAVPLVKGFVGRLYCGRMAPGMTWVYTMNLVPEKDGPGHVESVACDSDLITAKVDNSRSPITPLRIRVQAPTTAGEFEMTINVKFAKLSETVPVKVFGRVES